MTIEIKGTIQNAPDFKTLFFIALGIIILLAIYIGIQGARKTNQKNKFESATLNRNNEIDSRNKVIAKQLREIDLLKIKLKQLENEVK